MPYPIEKKFVVAVSSTVLFDLSYEHALYMEQGLEAFRRYQHEHRDDLPKPGTGFPFIRRLLMLNQMYPEEHPVDVVILSRYHADDGMRVLAAVREYGLDITRAFFMAGRKPYPFMESVNATLYLSTNAEQVREAVALGYPAGHVLPCEAVDDEQDDQLRIAFDFDGVLVDDEAEKVYKQTQDLDKFRQYELENRDRPLKSGPLMPLFQQLAYFQKLDSQRAQDDSGRKRLLRISIVTARGAPAHERLNNTLSSLGLEADEVFLMGGIEKKRVLDILKPHLFFDDQLAHLQPVARSTPSVHIPFGIANRGGEDS
ncbi:MAG TPA: 5'-nucleotidase [Kiritimatiellia bacterium]|nr:5'-nucleotidase [Kiritimatiellia bacterium]HOE36200.1 5'-nucleotidase [Kiritimatiellia bacterium]HOR73637.1 5'-nucleotidase [Kiritimatiellia bacterium]HOU58601.1 5'-nucleotidase [Kiritimatiellia bacterium]HPK68581.1 5'-nucleotidase [Kiritimatiellia bacterium]